MRAVLACVLMMLLCSGCATTEKLRASRAECELLRTELVNRHNQITALEGDNARLSDRIVYLKGVSETLKAEKAVRIAETSDVRRTVRRYVGEQVKAIGAFARASHLLDYVGAELIERAETDGSQLLLADLAHPISSSGTLTDGRLYATGPMQVYFCILRPIGEKCAIVWKSRKFDITTAGLTRCPFESVVAVEQNDIAGIYVDGAVAVPFDKGTGRTGIRKGKVRTGQTFGVIELPAEDNRSYSFGVDGFLGE